MSRADYLELLARGYPYLRILSTEQGQGAREAAVAYAAAGFHERHVPRDVALFALHLPERFTEEDVRQLVTETLATARIEGPRFVLEALVGTDRLVAIVLDALGARAGTSLEAAPFEGEFRALGMMLRRMASPQRAKYTESLRTIARRISPRAVRAFEIVTGGYAKVAAHGKRDARGELTPYDLIFADDNPREVAAALARMHIDDTVRPNIRLAYLGGEDGLLVICRRAHEFAPGFRSIFAEDFGPMETPKVAEALASLGLGYS